MMSAELHELEQKAMTLTVKERAELAEHLLASLDNVAGQELENMWGDEAERRYQAYVSGTVESAPMADAIEAARKRIK
jgi:putative addiction module component (TIGR02574 family)